METTQKFIYEKRLGKGSILKRKKDGVVIKLTGSGLKSLVGFTDFGVGDKHNWLLEYDVIKSPYLLHNIIRVYSGGCYSGEYEQTNKFNIFGLGARFLLSMNIFSHPMLSDVWEIIEQSNEMSLIDFKNKTNGNIVGFQI